MLEKNILQTSELTKIQKHFLLTLDTFCDPNGKCWPSQATIAQRMSVSVRYVKKILSQLVELKLISVKRRWRKSNVYHLLCRVKKRLSTMGNSNSQENRPILKNNVNGNAVDKFHKRKASDLELVREIENITRTTKDRRCWEKVVKTCSTDTVLRAISSLKIAMNEISLNKPGAYLVSILKAEHPGLFGSKQYDHTPNSPTQKPVEPLRPLSDDQWSVNMSGLKMLMSQLRC